MHRKGIRGDAIDYLVYVKYTRDKLIEDYLQNDYNPDDDVFKKYVSDYAFYFSTLTNSEGSFLRKDYWELT